MAKIEANINFLHDYRFRLTTVILIVYLEPLWKVCFFPKLQ